MSRKRLQTVSLVQLDHIECHDRGWVVRGQHLPWSQLQHPQYHITEDQKSLEREGKCIGYITPTERQPFTKYLWVDPVDGTVSLGQEDTVKNSSEVWDIALPICSVLHGFGAAPQGGYQFTTLDGDQIWMGKTGQWISLKWNDKVLESRHAPSVWDLFQQRYPEWHRLWISGEGKSSNGGMYNFRTDPSVFWNGKQYLTIPPQYEICVAQSESARVCRQLTAQGFTVARRDNKT